MKNNRIHDKRYDGYRFTFKVKSDRCYMEDTLQEFPVIVMPNQMGEILSQMLGDLHQYQQNERNKINSIQSLIEVVENTDIDKDILITCIKYGMEYKVEE